MDLKQISNSKVIAVTYDAHYYIIQYEGQESDFSILINKEPHVGQSQNWASTIQLIPGFNIDYFPFAIAKEYRALVLLNLKEKTKERIVKLTSQPTNSKFSTRLLVLPEDDDESCSLYTDVRHIGLIRILLTGDYLRELAEQYPESES